jgi:hypothetical protein
MRLPINTVYELRDAGVNLNQDWIPQHQFDGLTQKAKTDLIEAGFRIVWTAPPSTRTVGPGQIHREKFDALPNEEKSRIIREGIQVVD